MPASALQSPTVRRLLGSKWTAAEPKDRDKHFTVVHLRAENAEGRASVTAELEALISRRSHLVPIEDLKDRERWHAGWR